MADIETLRLFVNERLTAVAEDILSVFIRTIVQYQQDIIELQRRRLDCFSLGGKPRVSDVLPLCEEVDSPEHRQQSPTLAPREEPEPSQIKEEQEEIVSSRPAKKKADPSTSTLSAVKIEDGENRETAEPVASTSTEHVVALMTTQADVEDCGASQPTSDVQLLSSTSDVQLLSSHGSESDTEDSDVWAETTTAPWVDTTREASPALNTLKLHDTQNVEGGQRLSLSNNTLSQELNPTSKPPSFTRRLTVDTGRPFSCTVCGKSFGGSNDLKKHMRTHTGEKPFVCTVCGKTFNQNGNLKRHMVLHTGEKPFSCTDCGKSFCRKNDLKMHMRAHTGESWLHNLWQ